MPPKYGILLDLDETLIRTEMIAHLRRSGNWSLAAWLFSQTHLPSGTLDFLNAADTLGSLGVVTRTPRAQYAEPLIEYHKLPHISAVVGYEDVRTGFQKPCPDQILEAARMIGCDPWHCVYIGDQPDDMEAAQRAGAIPIGLLWPSGRHPRTPLLDAYRTCASWDEVLNIIRDLIVTGAFEQRQPRVLPAGLTQLRWRERCLSILDYRYLTPTPESNNFNLIRSFKEGDVDAYNRVLEVMRKALDLYEPVLRDELCCRYILAAPHHTVGTLHYNDPCERLCRAFADVYPWLTHIPEALERTIEVQRSSTASNEHVARPSVADHLDSIRYVGQRTTSPSDGIVLLDDVFTEGATSTACRTILQDATGCAITVGLFVARTYKPSETR